MRNLKKFLALVLAMMMTLSLMVSVNAASDFTDVDAITDEFSEGVAVLEGLEVFEGYPDKTFKPKNSITRAEVATIVYRLATGDTEGNQAHLYKDYATFTDVTSDHWAAGYINYCANAEWIAGYGNGKFGPNDSVTGYQAAAMILRAVGYGKNNEFTGSGWQVQVANVTRSEGLLENVNKTTYAATLNQPATRELVAEILFQAGNINTVKWTMLQGYQNSGNGSLGWQNFRLRVGGWMVVDDWGNPGYKWYKGSTAIATVSAVPDMEFTDTKHECDIAHELNDKDQTFDLYLNGKTAVTGSYLVVATDTVTKVGGQGRLTKIYDTLDHPWDGREYPDGRDGWVYDLDSWDATVTMVDTFLARVTYVADAVLDAAGHIITPARLTLTIYDQTNGSSHVVSKKSTDATNWEYSVGDMILMNAYTNHTPRHSGTEDNKNKAAFETEPVVAGNLTQGTNAWVLHVADSKVAKQTTVYYNQGKHCVDGTDIPDQIELYLNVAGTTTNSDFTWYFDDYDNIIGIGDAIKSNYGVITSIYSSFTNGDSSTNGEAVARAHVKYADGSEGDVVIDRFLVANDGTDSNGHIAAGTKMDGDNATASSREVAELLPVYDYSVGSSNVMTAGPVSGTHTVPSNVEASFDLYVSPVASINKNAEGRMNGVNNGSNAAESGKAFFGIIEQNLYKFVTAGDGKVTAIEVAGDGNNNVYAGNNNEVTTAAVTLKKSAGFLTVDGETVRVDNNTKIILKEDTKINVYNGLNSLTGDVDVATLTEVDWVDADGNGIAEVLYTTGAVKGTVTYGLFYYNGGGAQWNSTDKKGTMTGWLNAEPKTLTFTDQSEFNLILANNGLYTGRIYAVQMTNDEVTNLMGENNADGNHFERSIGRVGIVSAFANVFTRNKNTSIGATGITALGSTAFVTGVQGGNAYDSATWVGSAMNLKNDTDATITYYPANNTIVVSGSDNGGNVASYGMSDTFYLTGSTKVVGNTLYYLENTQNNLRDSHVTIVFDSASKVVSEIYVTTEPDNTPGTGSVAATGVGDDVNQPVSTPADVEAFKNILRNNPNTGVWFWNTATTDVSISSQPINSLLFFPFRVNNSAGGESALLTIYDSNGDTVYTESITTGATTHGMNWIVIEYVVGAGNTSTGYWHTTQHGLNVGTYTYTVDVAGVRETSGSFTME